MRLVKDMHGVWLCKCGRKLAGCNCPQHQTLIQKLYPTCIECKPNPDSRPIKERMGIHEK